MIYLRQTINSESVRFRSKSLSRRQCLSGAQLTVWNTTRTADQGSRRAGRGLLTPKRSCSDNKILYHHDPRRALRLFRCCSRSTGNEFRFPSPGRTSGRPHQPHNNIISPDNYMVVLYTYHLCSYYELYIIFYSEKKKKPNLINTSRDTMISCRRFCAFRVQSLVSFLSSRTCVYGLAVSSCRP